MCKRMFYFYFSQSKHLLTISGYVKNTPPLKAGRVFEHDEKQFGTLQGFQPGETKQFLTCRCNNISGAKEPNDAHQQDGHAGL